MHVSVVLYQNFMELNVGSFLKNSSPFQLFGSPGSAVYLVRLGINIPQRAKFRLFLAFSRGGIFFKGDCPRVPIMFVRDLHN